MEMQDYVVELRKGRRKIRVEMPAYTPQRAAKAAVASEPEASLVGARVTTTWRVVKVCEVCGCPIFSDDDWQMRRGKVRCYACG